MGKLILFDCFNVISNLLTQRHLELFQELLPTLVHVQVSVIQGRSKVRWEYLLDRFNWSCGKRDLRSRSLGHILLPPWSLWWLSRNLKYTLSLIVLRAVERLVQCLAWGSWLGVNVRVRVGQFRIFVTLERDLIV